MMSNQDADTQQRRSPQPVQGAGAPADATLPDGFVVPHGSTVARPNGDAAQLSQLDAYNPQTEGIQRVARDCEPSDGLDAHAPHPSKPRGASVAMPPKKRHARLAADGQFHRGKPLPRAALGALGVVFGDIGTSPLYSLKTVFSVDGGIVKPNQFDVFGIISLVFWSVMLVVTFKYVVLAMRADNQGEGGILALMALVRRSTTTRRAVLGITVLGIFGAGLFYGDSVITPAMSVMSAIEGLDLIAPNAASLVVPISAVILTLLFAIQRYGTGMVGKLFGPVMLTWFLTLGLMGLPHIVANPAIMAALLPHHAIAFILQDPAIAFIALGAVVLTITGAEALYADMGHFGALPIRMAWLCIVLPCLTLNYLGQGALVLADATAIRNPFFRLVSEPLVLPVVLLGTAATVIASQSVISGAFSVSQQALHLGLLPRLAIRHTSRQESGQIYVPVLNGLLFVGVLVLVLGFRSSEALANAYGLAVTGTLILTTTLLGGMAHRVWRRPTWQIVPVMALLGVLELAFLSGNVVKIVHGGWLPLAIAGSVVLIMLVWMRGATALLARRAALEGTLSDWIERAKKQTMEGELDGRGPVRRVPGQAIYLHASTETVPLALKETLRFYHALPEQIVLVTVRVHNLPHIHHVDRVSVRDIDTELRMIGITIDLGFDDSPDVPHNLYWSAGKNPNFVFDAENARYILSDLSAMVGPGPWYTKWAKQLFVWLRRNAATRQQSLHLPLRRTASIGGAIYL